MSTPEGWVVVHLLALPVPVAAQAQQHVDELLREFALVTGGGERSAEHALPVRLLELVDALTRQFAGVGDDARDRLEAAAARGDAEIADHQLVLPPEAGPASVALGAMLDEADEYCRRGQHLLTLATPEDSVAYRRWYLGQVVDQLAGRPPVAWPQWRASPAGPLGDTSSGAAPTVM